MDWPLVIRNPAQNTPLYSEYGGGLTRALLGLVRPLPSAGGGGGGERSGPSLLSW